jgi:rod shape-determining protein MreD
LKDALFLVLLMLPSLVIQTTSLGFLADAEYKPDLILIIVAWASLRIPFLIGVGVAFCGGILMDLFSGCPSGLFSIVYCLVLLLFGYMDSKFQVGTNTAKVTMIFIATLASGCMVLLMRRAGGPTEFGWHIVQWVIVKSGITAAASAIILPLLDKLWWGYSRLVGTR